MQTSYKDGPFSLSQRVGALWLQQKCTSSSPPLSPSVPPKNPKPVPRKEGGRGIAESLQLSLFNSAFSTLCPRPRSVGNLSNPYRLQSPGASFFVSLHSCPSGYIFLNALPPAQIRESRRIDHDGSPSARVHCLFEDGRTDADGGNANRSLHSSWKKA